MQVIQSLLTVSVLSLVLISCASEERSRSSSTTATNSSTPAEEARNEQNGDSLNRLSFCPSWKSQTTIDEERRIKSFRDLPEGNLVVETTNYYVWKEKEQFSLHYLEKIGDPDPVRIECEKDTKKDHYLKAKSFVGFETDGGETALATERDYIMQTSSVLPTAYDFKFLRDNLTYTIDDLEDQGVKLYRLSDDEVLLVQQENVKDKKLHYRIEVRFEVISEDDEDIGPPAVRARVVKRNQPKINKVDRTAQLDVDAVPVGGYNLLSYEMEIRSGLKGTLSSENMTTHSFEFDDEADQKPMLKYQSLPIFTSFFKSEFGAPEGDINTKRAIFTTDINANAKIEIVDNPGKPFQMTHSLESAMDGSDPSMSASIKKIDDRTYEITISSPSYEFVGTYSHQTS